MKRTVTLTDDLIRQALTRRGSTAPPDGLLEAIAADVRRSPQRRPVLRWFGAHDAGASPIGERRLAWVLAAVALMLAVAAGALVGAHLLHLRDPSLIDLMPTGIESLTPEGGGYEQVLVDGQGTSWAIGRGHVTRFDPRTGAHETWTVSNDAAFARAGVTPMPAGNASASRAGGVWLTDRDRILRFDGTAFRQSLPVPAGAASVNLLAESPSGSLWASDGKVGLWRWSGSGWQAAPAGRKDVPIWSLAVLSDDDVWVGEAVSPGAADSVSHLSGGRWESLSETGVPALGAPFLTMTAGADGTIWVGSSRGVARYRGGVWASLPAQGIDALQLAVSSGTLWALTRESSVLMRQADGAWTQVPLTGTVGDVVSITAGGSDVYLGTTAGLYRHDGARWTQAWQQDHPEPALSSVSWRNIAAVSQAEAWVGDVDGVWHYVGGSWAGPEVPSNLGTGVRGLALGPGGELVAVTSDGISVRRFGRWTTAWTPAPFAPLGQAAVAEDGSIWFGGGVGGGDAPRLVHLESSAAGWRETTISCPLGGWLVTIGSDGAVWTGGIGYNMTWGLARFDGRTCEALMERDVVALVAAGPSVIAVTQEGTDVAHVTQSVVRVDPTGSSATEATYTGLSIYNVAVGPYGEIWYETPEGLGRSVGGTWRAIGAGIDAAGDISIAPDGAVWFYGSSGIQRIRPDIVAR